MIEKKVERREVTVLIEVLLYRKDIRSLVGYVGVADTALICPSSPVHFITISAGM
jgi:hypothetical protein